ncbi:tyrosine-type recombinase/integrase [Saccharothrix syringae]|uniref:Site-specific integrase n=1 Tax=Saccharothrix syringae TaxID=103733 RepID=A0A5Q0GS58_SACSY|nr:tyrosine-type recombinase/integrase [Saccharothrix syringae]QFZ16897.1 site-specific integrase [Saccharothrix syringae]
MGHVQDRWWTVKDGKREKTPQYGKGMRYKVRFPGPDGRERSKTFPDRQKAAADAFLHEIETDKNKGTYLDPNAGRITFRDYTERHWIGARTFDESTREGVEFRLKLHVYPYFGDTELRLIQPSTIQAWERKLQQKGLAETYRRTIFANVSAIFTAAIDDERLRKNPCNGKSVIKPRGEYPKIVPWVEERVHAVRASLGERYRVAVNLGAGCGLRQGEVFGFSPDDVDESEGVIHVLRQIKIVRGKMVFAPPKHGKTRDVPLAASVADAIKAHVEEYKPLPITLPWGAPDGKPMTVPLMIYTRESKQLYRHSFNHHVWKPALRAAGVKAPGRAEGFHALRHFYASSLLEEGVSIRALAEYLGHADPAFTLRVYTHLMPASHERTRAAVDKVFGAKLAEAA